MVTCKRESVIVSFRMPRRMSEDMDRSVKEGRYASKTELMREALREKLYKSIDGMKGALKGKVKVSGSMRAWRLKVWKQELKKAKGDARPRLRNHEK